MNLLFVEQHSQQLLFNIFENDFEISIANFLALTSSSRWINAQFAVNFYWLKSLSDHKRGTTGRIIRVSTNNRSFKRKHSFYTRAIIMLFSSKYAGISMIVY